jgi:hypothetical protein
VPAELADTIAFKTVRAYPEIGEDWILYLLPYQGGKKITRLLLRKEQSDYIQRVTLKNSNESEVKAAS